MDEINNLNNFCRFFFLKTCLQNLTLTTCHIQNQNAAPLFLQCRSFTVALIWKWCRQELSPPYELFVIAGRAPPPPARCQLYVNPDRFSGLVAGRAARGREGGREQPRRRSEPGPGREGRPWGWSWGWAGPAVLPAGAQQGTAVLWLGLLLWGVFLPSAGSASKA